MSVDCYPCLCSRVSYDLHLQRGIVSSTLLLFHKTGQKDVPVLLELEDELM